VGSQDSSWIFAWAFVMLARLKADTSFRAGGASPHGAFAGGR
jgi:hypothetical protein